MSLHDFLVQHAKFPFPVTDELRTAGTTDVSQIEVGLLESSWKATHAVRDDNLFPKLCNTLQNALENHLLAADSEHYLLASFSPNLEVDEGGREDEEWFRNPSESQSRKLLDLGFHQAASKFLWKHRQYRYRTVTETTVEEGSSKVDYVVLVDDDEVALVEAKSPSVMKKVGELLPPRGFELTWVSGRSLVPKILTKAALYLGLRRMEWLFLSCHNYWIVCRLVKDDEHPFLAYSPKISIEDSSVPFRAFLGAILSVVEEVSVEASHFNPNMQLDTIVEDEDEGPLDEADVNDGSGAYKGSSSNGMSADPPMTRGREKAQSGLMITSSSPKSPESFQVWVHLHPISNNTLALPHCSKNMKRRLWLTRSLGSGSTGNVWQCRFDHSNDLFAIKIVECLRRSDADSRQRLRNEFNIYLTLDEAYRSGQLRHHIAPHCYGAFESDSVDVLILELCDGILNAWDELSASEGAQVFKLVQDLHSIGIVHEDLEPRNIVRAYGGGFRLIDFSESRQHICKESKVGELHTHPKPVQNRKCSELQTLRHLLRGRPLQADHVNLR